MGKSISGAPLYELKVVNPNAIVNFSEPKLAEAAAKDFTTYVGRQVQGFMIKGTEAKALIEKVKKDMIAKKVEQPWIRAGVSGSDLLLLVTDLKSAKYEQSCVLFSGYIPMREKQKTQTAMVVNLDKGDDVIDEAATDMAKAKNTTAVEGKDAKFAGISGSTPIILLAHGDEDKTSTGQIYGKDFAGKQPKELVAMLLDNKDEKKRLSKDYAGTIYLDGCFTAQGGAMKNYTMQVWDLLKGRGLKNVRVKGNLGAAATMESGDEVVTTTEAEEKADKLEAEADKALEKILAPYKLKKDGIWAKKYQKKGDKTGYDNDPEVKKIKADMKLQRDQMAKRLETELKKIPGYEVENLVGQFGLELLR
jgi:hypothetical protein